MMRIKLALRNILRNRRRTLLNLTMIAGGYAAIVLFQGFAASTLVEVRNSAINNQYGHLQIAKKNFWNQRASETSKDRAIKNPEELIAKLKRIPGVEYASGRITFHGLLSTGDKTIAAQFIAYDPKVETRMSRALRIQEGRNFDAVDGSTNPVLGGIGLIKKLGGTIGQDLTILTSTVDGVINAIDVKLAGIFVTTFVEIDDSSIYLPLETAQKILDTGTVDRVVVLAKEDESVKPVRRSADQIAPSELQTKEWTELALLFSQVEDFYSVQNMVIEVIILLLVLLSITNTVSMTIFERTGEIGTLRAIGDKSSEIIRSFCLEGLIMGAVGSILGVILAIVSSLIINYLAIPIVIPGASVPIPVLITFLPKAYALSVVLLVITTITATYIPAAKIAGMNIVEALRHNI